MSSVSIFPSTTITTLLTVTASLLLIQSQPAISFISVTAPFRQDKVTGNITFTQASSLSPTIIHVSLDGLSPQQQYLWHVHQYPFSSGDESPCSAASVGGHYDPFQESKNTNYTTNCQNNESLCEVGDLSGRHSKLNGSNTLFSVTDAYLSLYGQYSIIGRSIVIHFNDGSRYVCANIEYPENNGNYPVISYVPFRGGSVVGDIRLVQYSDNATVVHTKLFNTDVPPPSLNHNWHVHVDPVTLGDTTCSSAGGHYNPGMVDITSNYVCNGSYPFNCEVGDLSGKGGALSFSDHPSQSLYTDTDLPIAVNSKGFYIANRSIVIHDANYGAGRLVCGDIIGTSVHKAMASFNGGKGVNGTIRFSQASPVSPTEVEIDLMGLNGMAGSYYVYETPVGGVGVNGRCSLMFTGDRVPPEIGDLSGKFGLLNDTIMFKGLFTDPHTPLYGSNSIIGRSIVIHDTNGERWACADIVYDTPTVEVSTMVNVSGSVMEFKFIQPANDPYSDTTIIIKMVPIDGDGGGVSSSSSSSSTTSQMTTPTATPTTTSSTSTTTTTSPISMTSQSSSVTMATMSDSSTISSQSVKTSSIISSSSSFMSSSDSQSSSMATAAQSASSDSSSSVILTTTPTSSSFSMMTTSPSSSTVSSTSDELSLILSSSFDIFPNPSMQDSPSRRKRDEEYDEIFMDAIDFEDEERHNEHTPHRVVKREVVSIKWSVKNNNNGGNLSNCDGLEDFLPTTNVDSMSLCSMGIQLACSAGALSQKHGMIQINSENGVRMVLTDPYLPLSGPNSVIGNLLLISIDDGVSQYVTISNDNSQQDPVTCSNQPTVSPSSNIKSTTTATPTAITTTTATPTQTSVGDDTLGLPLSLPIFIIVCVGGAIALAVVVLLVIVVIVCCVRRRNHYAFDDYMKTKSNNVELGVYKRSNPIEATDATYEVLYDYKPQQDGDLALTQGQIITIVEAPVGGEWWKGNVDGREGWFPKTYVNYVDMKAEEKKKKEAQLEKAEQVIRAYTMATGSRLSANRLSALNIDSTPRSVTKFDQPLKEVVEEETTLSDNFPLPNTPPASRTGTPSLNNHRVAPDTKTKHTEITIESPPSSNESISRNTVSPDPVPQSPPVSPVSASDVYIAKFDLVPESNSELKLVAGEQVIVLEKNDNGWWHGVVGERQGWVPETFLELMEDVDKANEVNDSVNEEEDEELRPRGMTEFHSGTSEEVNVNEYRAITDYQSETEGDLSFKEGDQVLVYWGNDDGWWFGAAGSAQGYFPGSYVEPVMEESAITSDNTLSPVNDVTLPPNDANGDDTVSSPSGQNDTAIKEETNDGSDKPSVNEGESGSLADQIATAFKKKKQQQDSSITATTGSEVGSVHSQDDTLRERSDSVEKLSTDIVAMISGMGDDGTGRKETKAKTLQAQRKAPTRTPSRRAPPPPSATRTKSKSSKQKPTTLKEKNETAVTSVGVGNIPVPPPPPPLPDTIKEEESTVTKSSKETTKDQTNDELSKKEASNVVTENKTAKVPVKEPAGSAESSPSRRRKPPPPPAAGLLVANKSPATPTSPSPLIMHSFSKSPTPPVIEVVPPKGPEQVVPPKGLEQVDSSSLESAKEQTTTKSPLSPTATIDKSSESTAAAQKPPSSSKWQPQSKIKRGTGWKPQTAKQQQQESTDNNKKSSSSPKIKVQKVKRPQRNIPPPPSAPLPPPPTKKSSTTRGPPPVKKVLGPPPVKKVLGGSQMAKKPVKSPPTSPPPVSVTTDSSSTTAPSTATRSTPVKVPPPPLTLVSDQPEATPSSGSTPTKPKVKPAVSPKPKIKPAISPKPRKLILHPDANNKPVNESPSPGSKTPESILKNSIRPVPPKRGSSLPNTPEGSPAPSPSPQSRFQHKEAESNDGNVPVPQPRSHNKEAESTDHHGEDNERTKRNSVPSRPPPPKTNVANSNTSSTATDPSAQQPVAPARKKSNTLPPPQKPNPPITVPAQNKKGELSSQQNPPASRKVSDVGARVKNLISPMKPLEGRPSREGTRSLSTPSEEDEETSKPTPKRRTSQQSNNEAVPDNNATPKGPVAKSTSLPARPPPPSTAAAVKPTSPSAPPLGTDDNTASQPIPKPRAKTNNDSTSSN